LNIAKLARAIAKFQRAKDSDFIYQIVFYDAGVGPVTDVVPKEDRGWFDFNGNLIESKPPFLPTRLVLIAALLRRYSPSSPHPLLRLLSHVPAPSKALIFT
jgi:hypothetical protein